MKQKGGTMKNWDKDSVEQTLRERDWYESEREIQHATQFILVDGTRINCFQTGRVQIQGADSDIKSEATEVFSEPSPASRVSMREAAPAAANVARLNRVFIVYGHDIQAREQLELLLRRLKLDPIVLQNIAGGGDTIIEKLERLTDADFACVLLTPDDEGRRKADGDEVEDLRPRARQNVVLELGMVLARLGRRRVAILVKGRNIEHPSDIEGLIYIQFSNHVDQAKNELAASLQEAGFNIQVADLLSGRP